MTSGPCLSQDLLPPPALSLAQLAVAPSVSEKERPWTPLPPSSLTSLHSSQGLSAHVRTDPVPSTDSVSFYHCGSSWPSSLFPFLQLPQPTTSISCEQATETSPILNLKVKPSLRIPRLLEQLPYCLVINYYLKELSWFSFSIFFLPCSNSLDKPMPLPNAPAGPFPLSPPDPAQISPF